MSNYSKIQLKSVMTIFLVLFIHPSGLAGSGSVNFALKGFKALGHAGIYFIGGTAYLTAGVLNVAGATAGSIGETAFQTAEKRVIALQASAKAWERNKSRVGDAKQRVAEAKYRAGISRFDRQADRLDSKTRSKDLLAKGKIELAFAKARRENAQRLLKATTINQSADITGQKQKNLEMLTVEKLEAEKLKGEADLLKQQIKNERNLKKNVELQKRLKLLEHKRLYAETQFKVLELEKEVIEAREKVVLQMADLEARKKIARSDANYTEKEQLFAIEEAELKQKQATVEARAQNRISELEVEHKIMRANMELESLNRRLETEVKGTKFANILQEKATKLEVELKNLGDEKVRIVAEHQKYIDVQERGSPLGTDGIRAEDATKGGLLNDSGKLPPEMLRAQSVPEMNKHEMPSNLRKTKSEPTVRRLK